MSNGRLVLLVDIIVRGAFAAATAWVSIRRHHAIEQALHAPNGAAKPPDRS